MPFYDSYFKNKPSRFGKRLLNIKANKVLNLLKLYQPKLNRILEIGPGWGQFAKIVKAEMREYYCVEANFGQATILKNQAIPTVVSLVPPIPFSDNQFDAVVASHILEHMPEYNTANRFISELIRITSPDGLLCINCPDFVVAGSLFWDADYTHNFPVTMRRLIQMYKDHCVEIVYSSYFAGTIQGILATPIGWIARYFPEKLIEAVLKPLLIPGQIHRTRMTFLRNVFVIGRVSNQII
jgi:SAM-dependent methyltransferase